jgi:hypothetical protein
MTYFLIVYDRSIGVLQSVVGWDSREDALTARFEVEAARPAGSDIEVVVVAASSMEALERTHGRYFQSPQQMAERLS